MKISNNINMSKYASSVRKTTKVSGCADCASASCDLKNNCIKPESKKIIDPFKILSNALKLLALGIVLNAAYEQFFDNPNKPSIETKTINLDTIKQQSSKIIKEYKFIPLKDTLIKLSKK